MTIHSLDSIIKKSVKIYRGKNHGCRCGCCGNYAYKDQDKRTFSRYVNDLRRRIESNTISIDDVILQAKGGVIVNMPFTDENDRCYCIYTED